jgi:hypothetical protein
MTVKPTDHVVRMIELKAKDGNVLEAKLDAKRVRREYEGAARSLGQFGADIDAVQVAERYRQLISRLRVIEELE